MMRKNIKQLTQEVRQGWERRIDHDYLGWMNDRVLSDYEMFLTGQRDFMALTADLDPGCHGVALDLGCGVGRLMREAAKRFEKVVGVDISETALEKARDLLAGVENVEFNLGSGVDLKSVTSESIDYAYSFGVLTNIPTVLCSAYILELGRVLRQGGLCQLLFLLGEPQPTVEADTAAYRSYERERLEKALEYAGFEICSVTPFLAGIDIPEESPFQPMIVTARKERRVDGLVQVVSELMLPGGEAEAGENWPGSHTEYILSVMRAEELMRKGHLERAKKSLSFAVSSYKEPHPKLLALLRDM